MPAVESSITFLIVPLDEALRPNICCLLPQCSVTDDLLCRAYDSSAWMGRIGNSLSHLMPGLSSSLETVPLDQLTQGLVNAPLQAFVLKTQELEHEDSEGSPQWFWGSSPAPLRLRPWNAQPRSPKQGSRWLDFIDVTV
ncbi:hypothetical protein GOODEAATRI_025401, partial [Goodea atripinnis]